MPEYALKLEQGEKMASFDIQAGYRHFRLAPKMKDWFLFRYDGRFYRCSPSVRVRSVLPPGPM
jgi:hypothetical protein